MTGTYPTPDAYEAACRALETHRQRADNAERARDAYKAQRDHLLTVLGNCAAGLRRALDPRTPDDLDAARELLRQADEALANYEGAPWVTS